MNVNEGVPAPHFAATFPLPFRVLFLVGLGILSWATNLHGLDRLGIDSASAIDLKSYDGLRYRPIAFSNRPDPGSLIVSHISRHYVSVYRLFVLFSIWVTFAWIIFRYATFGEVLLVDKFRYIAAICGLVVTLGIICPFNILEKRERDMFLQWVLPTFITLSDVNEYAAPFDDVCYLPLTVRYTFQTWCSPMFSHPSQKSLEMYGSLFACSSRETLFLCYLPRRDGHVGFFHPSWGKRSAVSSY